MYEENWGEMPKGDTTEHYLELVTIENSNSLSRVSDEQLAQVKGWIEEGIDDSGVRFSWFSLDSGSSVWRGNHGFVSSGPPHRGATSPPGGAHVQSHHSDSNLDGCAHSRRCCPEHRALAVGLHAMAPKLPVVPELSKLSRPGWALYVDPASLDRAQAERLSGELGIPAAHVARLSELGMPLPVGAFPTQQEAQGARLAFMERGIDVAVHKLKSTRDLPGGASYWLLAGPLYLLVVLGLGAIPALPIFLALSMVIGGPMAGWPSYLLGMALVGGLLFHRWRGLKLDGSLRGTAAYLDSADRDPAPSVQSESARRALVVLDRLPSTGLPDSVVQDLRSSLAGLADNAERLHTVLGDIDRDHPEAAVARERLGRIDRAVQEVEGLVTRQAVAAIEDADPELQRLATLLQATEDAMAELKASDGAADSTATRRRSREPF